MNPSFSWFFQQPEQERVDAIATSAQKLDNLHPVIIEKDLWVCTVLDVLYSGLGSGHPTIFFKGGTSLSKAFNLINRFSEDVDVVISPAGLDFAPAGDLSGNQLKKLKAACADYMEKRLARSLAAAFEENQIPAQANFDGSDENNPSILIEYNSVLPQKLSYVETRVKIEGGARSGLVPSSTQTIVPYIAPYVPHKNFEVPNVTTIKAERTFWEKLLILHGNCHGFNSGNFSVNDRNKPFRHYYDVALIGADQVGLQAVQDLDLAQIVRNHNLSVFAQAWKKFEEAIPGTLRIVPQPNLETALREDYLAMRPMIFGEAPSFDWIIDQIRLIEATFNSLGSK